MRRELITEAKKVMDMFTAIGIPYGEVMMWNAYPDMKSVWGKTRELINQKTGKRRYIININIDLLDERNPLESLQSTIAHELLHTCPDCMNHGKQWKKHAETVTDCYPFLKIQTVTSAEEKKVTYQNPKNGPKYEITCEKCGDKFQYYRHCSWMDTMTGCTCPTCRGHKFTLKTLR